MMKTWVSTWSFTAGALLLIVCSRAYGEIIFFNDPNLPSLSKNFKTNAKTAKDHLVEHYADITACKESFALIKNDSQLIANWSYESTNQFSTSTQLLSKSIYAKHPSLRWLLNNASRIQIGMEDYQGGYFVEAKINNIFCSTQLPLRLFLLEKLGSSSEALVLRKRLLNELSDLHFPYMDASYGYSFETLKAEIKKSKLLYKNKELDSLKEWVSQTSRSVMEHLKHVRGEIDGMTVDQQRKIIKTWALELEALSK